MKEDKPQKMGKALLGAAVGAGLGAGLGLVFGSMIIGLCIGAGGGFAFGAAWAALAKGGRATKKQRLVVLTGAIATVVLLCTGLSLAAA